MSKATTTLSCTIPSDLGQKLNFLAQLEERSKSFYVKKALEGFLGERLEDVLLANLGEEAYREYLDSGKDSIAYDDLRKELDLDQ